MSVLAEIFNPNPVIQNSNFSLTLLCSPGTLVIGEIYHYSDTFGNSSQKQATLTTEITFDVVNSSSSTGWCYYSVKDNGGGAVYLSGFFVNAICFGENTKILCKVGEKEKYIKMSEIKEGTFVKTYKNEYKKVKYIGVSKFANTKENSIYKMYKLSKEKNEKLIDDLFLTGNHSILKSVLNEKEANYMKNYSLIGGHFVNDKIKLLVGHCKMFEPVSDNEIKTIYALVLENEDESKVYGIYANGILVESTSEYAFVKKSKFQRIGQKNISHSL
jgi:hypothetical protein